MIYEELQKLERLAVQVTKKMEAVNAENKLLTLRVADMEQTLQQKEQEIAHFKNKIKISNIVNNRPVNHEDAVKMSELIDNYIQEIDHLITYLSE